MTIWGEIPKWHARDWERFIVRAGLEPRTYCMLWVLITVILILAETPLSNDSMLCVLALFAMAALSV
jgi:hypothetical protein